jgi:hypothetical protein
MSKGLMKKAGKQNRKAKGRKRRKREPLADALPTSALALTGGKVGPFYLPSAYELVYNPNPITLQGRCLVEVDVEDPKSLREHAYETLRLAGRVQRNQSAGRRGVAGRGRPLTARVATAWRMMHGEIDYGWADVYRRLRIMRDTAAQRRVRTAFSRMRARHKLQYPTCSLCKKFESRSPQFS